MVQVCTPTCEETIELNRFETSTELLDDSSFTQVRLRTCSTRLHFFSTNFAPHFLSIAHGVENGTFNATQTFGILIR